MRICKTCGKPIRFGCMQDGDGFFYTHEGECFELYMDKTYGKNRWMRLGVNTHVYDGGYYLVTDDESPSGFTDPSIFYTEYDTGDSPVFCGEVADWIGAVMESETSDVPKEALEYLEKAYEICAKAMQRG